MDNFKQNCKLSGLTWAISIPLASFVVALKTH
jgi:hypothetical protein